MDPIDMLRALVGVDNLGTALTGRKAPGGWWIFSSLVRDQSNQFQI